MIAVLPRCNYSWIFLCMKVRKPNLLSNCGKPQVLWNKQACSSRGCHKVVFNDSKTYIEKPLSCLLAFNKHATWGSVTEYHLRKRSVTEFNSSSLFTCKFSQSSNWGVVVHCRCNCFLFQNTNLHTFPLGVYDAVYGILKTMFLNFKKQSDSILFSQKSWNV